MTQWICMRCGSTLSKDGTCHVCAPVMKLDPDLATIKTLNQRVADLEQNLLEIQRRLSAYQAREDAPTQCACCHQLFQTAIFMRSVCPSCWPHVPIQSCKESQ